MFIEVKRNVEISKKLMNKDPLNVSTFSYFFFCYYIKV